MEQLDMPAGEEHMKNKNEEIFLVQRNVMDLKVLHLGRKILQIKNVIPETCMCSKRRLICYRSLHFIRNTGMKIIIFL